MFIVVGLLLITIALHSYNPTVINPMIANLLFLISQADILSHLPANSPPPKKKKNLKILSYSDLEHANPGHSPALVVTVEVDGPCHCRTEL